MYRRGSQAPKREWVPYRVGAYIKWQGTEGSGARLGYIQRCDAKIESGQRERMKRTIRQQKQTADRTQQTEAVDGGRATDIRSSRWRASSRHQKQSLEGEQQTSEAVVGGSTEQTTEAAIGGRAVDRDQHLGWAWNKQGGERKLAESCSSNCNLHRFVFN
jgi:hypothetical protein